MGIRIRIRIQIRIRIKIRTYGFKAKGHKDIKLKAARLPWPGGMSGAPELTNTPCSRSAPQTTDNRV